MDYAFSGPMTRKHDDDAQELGFDQVLKQLTGIVEQLESTELPLEESLNAFERGVGLSRRGQAILDAAEQRIEVLLRDGSTEPLDPP